MPRASLLDDLCDELEDNLDEDLLEAVATGITEDRRAQAQEEYMKGEVVKDVLSFLDRQTFREWIRGAMRKTEEPARRLPERNNEHQRRKRPETKRRLTHEPLEKRIVASADPIFGLPLQEELPQPAAIVSRWMSGESDLGVDRMGRNHLENHGVAAGQGQLGTAADFERDEEDFFTIADSAQEGLDFSESFSFSFWFKVEDPQNGTDVRSIVYKWGGVGDWSYALYHIQEGGERKFELIVNSTGGRGGDGVAHLPFTMPVGEWFHALVTHDGKNGGETALHVGGVEVARARTGKTSIHNGGAEFRLGSHGTGGAAFTGGHESMEP